MGVQETWESFLEWSSEHGLPIKNVADWLEERGIPPLPTLAILFLALLIVAAVLILPMLAPAKASLLVSVKSIDGTPVSGATVYLTSPTSAFARTSAQTNANGLAQFKDLPTGEARISVQSANYEVPEASLMLKPGVNRFSNSDQAEFTAVPKLIQTVSMQVFVDGPSSATVTLFDTTTGELVNTGEGVVVSFAVSPDASYELRTEAAGWRSETRTVNVTGLGDLPLDVKMLKNDEDRTGKLFVQVLDAPGARGRPIANATIELIDNETENVLFTLTAGSDGWAEQEEVTLGTVLRAQARAEGFLTGTTTFTIRESENRASVVLARAAAPASTHVEFSLEDIDGNYVTGAIVRAWKDGERIAETLALDGTASMDLPTQATLLITAYKPGFLPASLTFTPSKQTSAKLVLEASSSQTASAVKVHVVNVEGLDVPGASITLSTADRQPLGLPAAVTGLDGLAQFTDVPLDTSVVAKASSDGRVAVSEATNVTLEGTPGENATLISLTLLPGEGTIQFTILDHFSRTPLEGVVVTLLNSEQTCTTKAGVCTLKVEEGTLRFTAAAAGYESLVSSEIVVKPNVAFKQTLELISSSLAKSAKLVFLGFYDLRGRKVNALSPASTYQARYMVRNPGLSFGRATAHIRLGASDRGLAQEPAAITGWDAAGATVYAGLGYTRGTTTGTAGASEETASSVTIIGNASPTASPAGVQVVTGQQLSVFGNETAEDGAATATDLYYAQDLHQPGLTEYKWVEFTFPAFQGSREFSIQFTTKPVESGRVDLSSRTAFYTRNETIRDPADAEAGVSKADLLAFVNAPESVEISFKGECTQSLCVQSWFEGPSGKAPTNYEAPYGEEFQLKFKVFTTQPNKALEASLSTDVQSLKLSSGSTGTASAQPSTAEGEQNLLLQAKTGADGRAEGSFSLQAVRLSKSAPLTLTFNTGTGEEDKFSKTLGVRVVGKTPNLRVQAAPGKLSALVDNAVTITVQDPLGQAVTDARVTLGRDKDALGSMAEAVYQSEGHYRAEGVQPQDSGFIDYTVQAEGFRTFTGRLPVVAEDFITIEPKTVLLTVNEKAYEQQEVTVRNDLKREVTVILTLLKSTQPAYTTVDTDVRSLRVKGQSSRTFLVLAKVSDAVPGVAARATTLRENVAGQVVVSARAGSNAEQSETVSFAVQTAYQQEALDGLWEVSTQSVNLAVKSPIELRKAEKLRITNNAPVPLLINVQLPYYPLSAEPYSMVVPAGGESELNLVANAVGEFLMGQGCLMDERSLSGDAIVYASFMGIRSSKKVAVSTAISSSDRCTPPGAMGIWLPTNAQFQFISPVKTKQNVDGSTVIQLANSDRALFNAPATVTAFEANVPAETIIELPSQYLTILPDGASLRFPAQVTLALPAGTNLAGSITSPRSVVYKNVEIQLPAGTRISSGYAMGGSFAALSQRMSMPTYYTPSGYYGNSAAGSVNYQWAQAPSAYGQPGTYGLHGSLSSQVAVIPANSPILVKMHSAEITNGKVVRLPVGAVFKPPAGSLVIEAEGTGQKVVQLPSKERFAVPSDAKVSGAGTATQASKGTLSLQAETSISVPLDSDLVLPAKWVGKLRGDFDNYEVRFPFTVDLQLPKGRYSTARLSDGRYLIVINRQEFIELSRQPRLSRDAVTVNANERIRFGLYTPEVEGGDTLAFPAELALTLPTGTSVLEGPNSKTVELPVSGAILEGESRLLVPYTAVFKPKNRPTSLELKTDMEFTLPIAWVPSRSEDNYTLVLPLQAKATISEGAQVRQEGGTLYISKLTAASGQALQVEGGTLQGRTIILPVGSKVIVFVNPPRELLRECSVEPFEFTLPFDTAFEFPASAVVSDNNRVVELLSPRTVEAFKSGASKFTYLFPRAHKYTFTGGSVTPSGTPRRFGVQVITGEGALTGSRLTATAGTIVRVDACIDNVPPSEQGIQVRLSEGVSFNMPDPTLYEETIALPEEKAGGAGTVQALAPFSATFQCNPIRTLNRAGARILEIAYDTDAVRFPSGNEGKTASTVVLNYELKPGENPPPYTTTQATVDVPPGSVVHFLPCQGRYSTNGPHTVVFDGDAISSRLRQAELNLSVTLDNSKLDAEIPLKFYYEGAEPRVFVDYDFSDTAGNVQSSAFGNSFQAADGKGLLQSLLLQIGEVKYAVSPTQPKLTTMGAITSTYGGLIDKLKVKIQVPKELRDEVGCVKFEANATVKVRLSLYTDQTRTKHYGDSDLYLNVTVRKTGTCVPRELLNFDTALNDFWVNFDNQQLNERSNQRMQFSFKNAGHTRPLELINNYFETVQVDLTDNAYISCTTPLGKQFPLPSGSLVTATCTGVKSGLTLIKATGQNSGKDLSREVRVIVYAPAASLKSLYASSPAGDAAPIVTDPSKKYLVTCAKHYCSFQQAALAVGDLLEAMSAKINDVSKNESTIRAYCDQYGGRTMTKSMPILLAGAYMPAELLKKYGSIEGYFNLLLEEQYDAKLGQKPITRGKVTMAKIEGLAVKDALGCGIYSVQVRIGSAAICPGVSSENFLKNANVELSFDKLSSCEESLANAALLMSSDDVDITAGRKILDFKTSFAQFRANYMKGFQIGAYARSLDPADQKTATALFQSFYGQVPVEKIPVILPDYYCHFGYTWNTVKYAQIAVGGLSVASCVAGILGANPFFLRLCYGLLHAGAFCAVGAATAGISAAAGGGFDSCDMVNWCTTGMLMGAAESLFTAPGVSPTGATKFAKFKNFFKEPRVWKALITDTAGFAAFTGISAALGYDPSPATVYMGGRVLSTIALGAWQRWFPTSNAVTSGPAGSGPTTPVSSVNPTNPGAAPVNLLPGVIAGAGASETPAGAEVSPVAGVEVSPVVPPVGETPAGAEVSPVVPPAVEVSPEVTPDDIVRRLTAIEDEPTGGRPVAGETPGVAASESTGITHSGEQNHVTTDPVDNSVTATTEQPAAQPGAYYASLERTTMEPTRRGDMSGPVTQGQYLLVDINPDGSQSVSPEALQAAGAVSIKDDLNSKLGNAASVADPAQRASIVQAVTQSVSAGPTTGTMHPPTTVLVRYTDELTHTTQMGELAGIADLRPDGSYSMDIRPLNALTSVNDPSIRSLIPDSARTVAVRSSVVVDMFSLNPPTRSATPASVTSASLEASPALASAAGFASLETTPALSEMRLGGAEAGESEAGVDAIYFQAPGAAGLLTTVGGSVLGGLSKFFLGKVGNVGAGMFKTSGELGGLTKGGAVAAAAAMLIDVQGEPVEILLRPEVSNHLVAIHREGSMATSHALCLKAKTRTAEQKRAGTYECEEQKLVSAVLDKMNCPVGTDVCLALVRTRMAVTSSKLPGYTLFAAVDRADYKSDALFNSVFSAESPILLSTEAGTAVGSYGGDFENLKVAAAPVQTNAEVAAEATRSTATAFALDLQNRCVRHVGAPCDEDAPANWKKVKPFLVNGQLTDRGVEVANQLANTEAEAVSPYQGLVQPKESAG